MWFGRKAQVNVKVKYGLKERLKGLQRELCGLEELHRRMKRKKDGLKERLRGMQRELIGLEEKQSECKGKKVG
jgi:hypothetical protein